MCVCVSSLHTHSKWHLFYFHNFLMAFALLGFFRLSVFFNHFPQTAKRNSCVYLVEKIARAFPQTRTNKLVQLQLPKVATATCNLQLHLLLFVCHKRQHLFILNIVYYTWKSITFGRCAYVRVCMCVSVCGKM